MSWRKYLRDEAKKEKEQREKRRKRQERANTKTFWQKQSFGAASEVRQIDVSEYNK